jgi:transcription initiation factor IIF auxiliary subunit
MTYSISYTHIHSLIHTHSFTSIQHTPVHISLSHSQTTGKTREWTVFVRTPEEEDLGDIERVTFQLHPTSSPSLLSLTEPPFQITRRGWDTFDMRVSVSLSSSASSSHDVDPSLRTRVFAWQLQLDEPESFSSHRMYHSVNVQYPSRHSRELSSSSSTSSCDRQ